MNDHQAAEPDPYDERSDYSWTEIAFELLDAGTLRGEVTAKGDVAWSRVRGPCPRCKHGLDDEQTLTAITGLGPVTRGSRNAVPDYLAIDITCACAERHAGAPDGVPGCGVSF